MPNENQHNIASSFWVAILIVILIILLIKGMRKQCLASAKRKNDTLKLEYRLNDL